MKNNIDVVIDDITIAEVPMNLLLLADPEMDDINKYLKDSTILAAKINNEIVGVIAIKNVSNSCYEIMNVAVEEKYQGNSIGKKLIFKAEEKARDLGGKEIEIGTGNSSIKQLELYKKLGFKINSIDKEFFIRNYKEEIFENGIKCVDMIRLRKNLYNIEEG